MDRDEIKKRTWVCSCGDQDAVLAEFDELTKDNEILHNVADWFQALSEERTKHIAGIEQELQKALMAEGYLKQAVDTYKPKAEALERICEPIGQEFKEDGPDILRSLCKDIALIRLARYPENIPQTLERICDYLDSQQKPQRAVPGDLSCREYGDNYMQKPCEHERGYILMRKDKCKPKDEEVLRGVLGDYDINKWTVHSFSPEDLDNAITDILKHFQLKEGE